MLDKFRHIRKLNGLYDVAVHNKSTEIRISTADIGLVVSDINKLFALLIAANKTEEPDQINEQSDIFIDAGKFRS